MKLNDLSKREKISLIFLFILVVGLIYYFYFYQPQTVKLNALRNKLDAKVKQLKAKSILLHKKKSLEGKYEKEVEKLNKEKKIFLKVNQKDKLIVDLNQLVTHSKIKLVAIKALATKKKNNYLQFPVQVQVTGNYNELINYLHQIRELDYIIRVNTLNVITKSKASNQIKAQLKLSSYALITEEDEKS